MGTITTQMDIIILMNPQENKRLGKESKEI
jgi:hypothetical protein